MQARIGQNRFIATILFLYGTTVASLCIWVPWVGPHYTSLIVKDTPSREVFVGYDWFWTPPVPEFPDNLIQQTRERWKTFRLDQNEIDHLREYLKSEQANKSLDETKLEAVKKFFDELRPTGKPAPDTISEEVVKLASDERMIKLLLSIADDRQTLDWLKRKANFDRTFPQWSKWTHEEQIEFLTMWNSKWDDATERNVARGFAKIKYAYILLEFLAVTFLVGGLLVFLFLNSLSKRT